MPDKKLKHLSLVQEIRADDDAEGIIEGYVAVWDTVDSYNSKFQRGCFKKTLENRMHKIKVLWNHDTEQPIGKLEDIHEDDHGLFVRAQLITEVEKAKDTYNLIKGGAIDCFSFGFRIVKDKFEQGVQVITEVMLGEISPVVFEANPASKITGVRSTDFNESLAGQELRDKGYQLFRSLDVTIDDLWWDEASQDDIVNLMGTAIDDFRTAYVGYVQEITDIRSGGTRMDISAINELASSFRKMCSDEGKTIEVISQNTSFTIEELRSLKAGKPIADVSKLKELGKEIHNAHNVIRSKAVETLCDELRAGINPAEATRIEALLKKSLGTVEVKVDEEDVVAFMSDFRKKLNGEK